MDARVEKDFQLADLSVSPFLDANNVLNFTNIQLCCHLCDSKGISDTGKIELKTILPASGLTIEF